jgi:DHA2 family multidrug resistance protein
VWSAHLSTWLTPLNPPYNALVARNEQALTDLGRAPITVHDSAVGLVYQALGKQSQVLAYSDVFLFCAVLAFAVAPLALLFSGRKGAPTGGAH